MFDDLASVTLRERERERDACLPVGGNWTGRATDGPWKEKRQELAVRSSQRLNACGGRAPMSR